MSEIRYDLDSLAAEYVPVVVVFRTITYQLGATIEQILGAVQLAKTVDDKAPLDQQLAIMPQVLAALSPELGAVVGDGKGLSGIESLLFQRAIPAALAQISKVPFRPVA